MEARQHGALKAAGSNPVAPTKKTLRTEGFFFRRIVPAPPLASGRPVFDRKFDSEFGFSVFYVARRNRSGMEFYDFLSDR